MKRTVLVLLTVCGILFGGFAVAQSLGGSDRMAATNNLQYSLEQNRSSIWVNPDTGNSGDILLDKSYHNGQGEYCREFTQTIFIGGEKQQGYGTACQQPDGTWRIVAEKPPEPPARVRAPVYDPYYDDRYYYPRSYWYPYRMNFSFGYYHHSGHRHHHKGNHHKGHHNRRGHHRGKHH